jgi:hypothetical protein
MGTRLGDVIIPDDPRWGNYAFNTADAMTLFWLLAGSAIVPGLLAVRDHRQRRAGKSGNRMAVSIGLIAAIAAVSLHHQQHEWYRCRTCFADRIVSQWRFGSWPSFSIPLTAPLEETTDSRFRRDFLSSDHVHDWVLAHSSCYHFFGTLWNGGVSGSGRWVTLLCETYERDPEFRRLVQAKLEDGALTRSNLLATIWIPPSDTPSPISNEERSLFDEFIRLGSERPQAFNK